MPAVRMMRRAQWFLMSLPILCVLPMTTNHPGVDDGRMTDATSSSRPAGECDDDGMTVLSILMVTENQRSREEQSTSTPAHSKSYRDPQQQRQ